MPPQGPHALALLSGKLGHSGTVLILTHSAAGQNAKGTEHPEASPQTSNDTA